MSSLFHSITSSAITSLLVSLLASCIGYMLFNSLNYKLPPKAPKPVNEGWPILGAIRFFTARWDFFRHARNESATGNFSFNIGNHPVIALNGEKGRQIFFESRGLGFAEGYAVLFGKSPGPKHENSAIFGDSQGLSNYFIRRITRMLKTDAFSRNLPILMEDVQTSLCELGNNPSGLTDPFESLYYLVFKLTMRIVACDDIAEDPALLKKMLSLYETVESSSTAASIIFPWFPSPAVVKRTVAGAGIYTMFKKIVDERIASGKRGNDPLQLMIDEGDNLPKIIEFVIGALFAGLLNSGINVGWVLVYLANDTEWLSKARAEIQAAASKHATDPTLPLTTQLSQLPLEAWESEFPVLDLCLRDSIRLQLLGAALRKNISGKDIQIGDGEVIPPGAFVAYHLGDVHLDPTVYREPEKWDPSRFLPGRAEDKKKPLSYIGWGVGRHPCLGMRFAKLEQNIIIAFFLVTFDFQLTDKMGTPIKGQPPVDFNGHAASKPEPPVYIKYTRRPVKKDKVEQF